MAITAAFMPQAATANIAVTASSASVALNASTGFTGNQVRVYNYGTAIAYIAFGTASTVTATTASLPIAPNSIEVFGIPYGTTYAAALGTSGGTVYFTLGEGL